MKSQLLITVLLSIGLTGCASLNSVSLTPVPANRGNEVTSETERWIIMGFNFDNDYADLAARNLARKCPGGKISGILTKDEVYAYFLFFVMKKRVVATGYCDRTVASAGKTGKKIRKINSVEAEAETEATPEESAQ